MAATVGKGLNDMMPSRVLEVATECTGIDYNFQSWQQKSMAIRANPVMTTEVTTRNKYRSEIIQSARTLLRTNFSDSHIYANMWAPRHWATVDGYVQTEIHISYKLHNIHT